MEERNNNNRQLIRKIVKERIPQSNIAISKVLFSFAIISVIVFIIFKLGILKSNSSLLYLVLILIPILFVLVGIYCQKTKGKDPTFKYVVFFLLFAFFFFLDVMSGYKSKALLPIIIVLSINYFDKKFTIITFIMASITLLALVYTSSYLYKLTGFIDLNSVYVEGYQETILNGNLTNEIITLNLSSKTLFLAGIRLSFLPNFVFLGMLTFVLIAFMEKNLTIFLKIEELSSIEANQRIKLSDMKTKVILSQVKPHFIYNTLSSIACLCDIEPKKAKNLTIDFSTYLRNNLDTLNNDEDSYCSFTTELDHIKSYLNIEQVRFEDTLKIEYDIKETDFSVPTLSIQPIVENAVKHGVSKKVNGGTVKISTLKVEDGYNIIIEDDGVGFDTENATNDGQVHIGLASIKERLESFGGKVSIQSMINVGTTVTVFIPKEEGLSL